VGGEVVKNERFFLSPPHYLTTSPAKEMSMLVGTLEVRMIVRESRTLKDKRQVVQSIKDRLRHSFNISIAEVEHQDDRQLITLGIAMVSNETQHLRAALSQVVNAVRSHPVAQLLDYEINA
jgi:uncharacterized protein